MATLKNMVVGDGQTVTDLLSDMLKEVEVEGFFGGLELKFESGRLVTIRKTQLFKPQAIQDSWENSNGQRQR